MKGKVGRVKMLAGVGIAIVIAGLVVSSQTAAADPAPPTEAETYAMTVRGQFGLENDLAYVRSLEDQPGLNTVELGTPLTPAETAQMVARQGVAKYVNDVTTALTSDSDFGGAWVDQSGDGGVVIAMTSSPLSAVSSLVSSIVPDKYGVKFVQVQRSMATMKALADQISSSPLRDASGAPLWIDVSPNVMANIVKVSVADQAHADLIYQHFGHDNIDVTITGAATPAANRDISSGPLYGGELIKGSNGEGCTMGYADLTNPQGQLYSITAGHCGSNGTQWTQGTAGSKIGSGIHANQTFGKTSTNCDCAFIGIISSAQRTNQVLVTDNAKYTYSHTGRAAVNEKVCHSGAYTGGIHCGPVTDVNIPVSVSASPGSGAGAFTLSNSYKVSAQAIDGDSGGPLGDGPAFLGILTARNGSTISYYTESVEIEATTNLTLHY